MMKANNQLGFININEDSIDKIIKDDEVIFERGFLREKTSTTLPITFGGVGKDLKDYKIYGNTHQKSTTGKNLLNYIDTFVSSGGGLTNVINDDGSITTTGVPTSNYRPIVSQYDIIDDLEDGQTYTISSETLNQFLYIQINAVKIAGGTDYIYNNSTRTQTFTVDKSKYNAYNIKIQTSTTNSWGSNSRTITNKYQLEKGGTATEFEPYTGGQPSPNPDYPQEIISCGDRTKNLFDINLSQSISNATKSVDGNNLTITCNGNNQNCYVSYDTSNINLNKTYYFSYTAVADNYAGVMIRAYKNDNTYEVIVDFTQTTKANLNFKVPDNTVYLRTYLYASRQATGGSIGNKTIYSNVHLGEEPYGYKIPVNVNNAITNIYLDEPLRKTKDGTYVDYIDFINQKVYRQLGGAEISDYSSFGVNAISARFIQYLTPAIENLKLNIRDGISFEESYFFCNYIRMFGGSTATSKIRINISNEYLGTTSSSTSQEAKQALINLMSGKTMEFVYPLETPTEEDIELPNIPTIEGNNTLNIETEITPSKVYIKYKSNT